jgi:hypothetical protein
LTFSLNFRGLLPLLELLEEDEAPEEELPDE